MSTQGIKAGKAFVEIFADDTKLSRDLRRISTRLKTFGTSVQAIGLKIMAVSAAMLAPMAGALKHFSSFGDQVAKMAKRTGLSVETLSELRFVASQTGTEFASLENAFRKMQRSIYDAGRGLSTQKDALEDLGLTFDNLKKLSPEEQFKLIGDRLGKVSDDTTQAAIAMSLFGRTGTNLIPMFEAGADGISALQQEARKLGLTMSKHDAKAAEDFTDAMDALGKSAQMTVFHIGAALAPAIQNFSKVLATVSKGVGDWIKQNRGVIVTIAAIVASVGVAGISLVALGASIKLLGVAFGILAKTVAIGIAVIKLLGFTLAAIVTPVGVVIAAVGALGAYLVYATGIGAKALNWLGDKFDILADDARQAYQGISAALASGDIGSAAKILWLTLKLEWTRGTAALREIWGALWYAVNRTMETAMYQMTKKFIDTIFTLQRWKEQAKGFLEDVGTTAKMIFGEFMIMNDASLSPEQREAAITKHRASFNDDFEKTEQAKNQALSNINKAHVQALKLVDQEHEKNQKQHDKEYIDKIKSIESDLAKAKEDRDKAVTDVVSNTNKGKDDQPPTLKPPTELLDGLKNAFGGLDALQQSFVIKGGFRMSQAEFGSASGSSLAQIASSTNRTAKAAEETAENTRDNFQTYG